ncbi:MAG: antibiotic biosynthesis monooxygenase [Chloroflexota bacterium]|nr:antibiotic biosynthesis monooxygenase [Chloroflexota bacterium]
MMIVEYIRHTIPDDRQAAFEAAYGEAQTALAASPHYQRWELSHCAEEPSSYILRIEWDSLAGHRQGSRRSPEFHAFFAAIRPYVDAIEEMRHYALTSVAGERIQA